MNTQFEIESIITIQSTNKVYVFAKILTPNIDCILSENSRLGKIDIEKWFDIPRAHDKMGNMRLDLYGFALKNNNDIDKIKIGQIVEFYT